MTAFTLLLMLAAPALAAEGAPPPKASLADVAFIAGHWRNEDGGALSEEVWTAPSGDSMLGMWRMVTGGKARIFELLSIAEAEGTLVLRLRHFDPRLVGREDKERAVELRLSALRGREASFEGSEYSGQGRVRLTYRRVDDERLSVTLDKGGKKEEFAFERAQP